jgi:hypothetical protein
MTNSKLLTSMDIKPTFATGKIEIGGGRDFLA